MKYFFECGGCDNYHPVEFYGDCRDDENRYFMDDESNMVNGFGHGYKPENYEIVPDDISEEEAERWLRRELEGEI